MRFLVIVKANEETEAGVMPTAEQLTTMSKYNEDLIKAGVLLDGGGLHPSSDGSRVEFTGEERHVIDGPFGETKELIAGFWIIEVKSREEAIEWVRRIPFSSGEVVELRRFFETSDFAEASPEFIELEAKQKAALAERQNP